MKLLLLGQNDGVWKAGDRDGTYMSGFEAWCFCPGVDGAYINAKLATVADVRSADIIMAGPGNTRDEDIIPELLGLQQTRGSAKWITMMDDARDCVPVDPPVRALLDGSDLVNVLNPRTLEFFRAITKTRCEAIGIPYPAEAVRKLARTDAKDIFIASRFYHPEHSSLEALVAAPLAEELGVRACVMYKESRFVDSRLQSYEERSAEEYLKLLAANAKVFINLDQRYTWGRDVLDCAALQIPCVVTRSTAHAERFFPDLAVNDAYDFARARFLVRAMYHNEPWYDKIRSNIPMELFEPYTRASMWKRLMEVL